MNKILIVHTSWYKEYVDEMKEISTEIINEQLNINI